MFTLIISLISHALHLILGIGQNKGFPPPLDAEEEKNCFLLLEKGDEEARQKLILHNLRLVSHIVRKYYSSSNESEDLVSIGSIGLCKAVDTYKISSGTKFATYASKCIQNEILMHFRSSKKLSNEVSINETIDVDRDGNPLTYMDIISVEDNVGEDIDKKEMIKKALFMIKNELSERERQIIVLRFGLFGEKSHPQREVAKKLSISRSYVSRIEKSTLSKIYEKIK